MLLTVSFDKSDKDPSGVCVMQKSGDNTRCLKIEIGEQADLIYKVLTDQSIKIVEIREV